MINARLLRIRLLPFTVAGAVPDLHWFPDYPAEVLQPTASTVKIDY